MTEKLKERKFGKFGWVSITDEKDDHMDQKITWPSKKEVLKKYNDQHPSTGGNGKSTTTLMRERWRALCRESRKRGYDFMAWEEYKGMWEAAGEVEVLDSVYVPAVKLQKKFYCKEFRTLLVRIDENRDKGFRPGNVAVIAVEGAFRNHRKLKLPREVQVLSYFSPEGEYLKIERGSEQEERIIEGLLDFRNIVPKGTNKALREEGGE